MNTRINILRTAAIVFLLGLFAAVPATQAQHPRTWAKAHIPFAFQYNAHTLVAGEYDLSMLSEHILVVRGKNGTAMAAVLPSDQAHQPGTGRLVFHRYGEQYVLREVWLPGLSMHLSCPVAKHHPRRELAQTEQPAGPADVEVAFVQPEP